MSVLARYREISEMEFLKTSYELQKFTIQTCMREQYFPKRYRFIFTDKIINSAMTVHSNLVYANSIFPQNENDLQMRKNYQKTAQIELQNLLHLLRLASEILEIKSTILEEWTGMILKEEKLIKMWRESDRKRYKF